ncbi:MAG: hypothetical protein U0931_14780 [Vulcanimicrobiota bacterium]
MPKFPILLTTRELRSKHFHAWEQKFYHDVWKMDYVRADDLRQDRPGPPVRVSAQPNRDERGTGWVGGVEQVRINSPETEELVLTSASGRFRWRAWLDQAGESRLEQTDVESGQMVPIWRQRGWARIEMASDPVRDRLVYGQCGGPLQSWDAKSAVIEPIEMPIRQGISDLSFAPDGRALAFVHAGEVYSHRLGSDLCQQVSQLSDEGKLAPAVTHLNPQWSPDGKRIFYIVHSYLWRGAQISDQFALMAALPDGSQRRLVLEQTCVADFRVGEIGA